MPQETALFDDLTSFQKTPLSLKAHYKQLQPFWFVIFTMEPMPEQPVRRDHTGTAPVRPQAKLSRSSMQEPAVRGGELCSALTGWAGGRFLLVGSSATTAQPQQQPRSWRRSGTTASCSLCSPYGCKHTEKLFLIHVSKCVCICVCMCLWHLVYMYTCMCTQIHMVIHILSCTLVEKICIYSKKGPHISNDAMLWGCHVG